MNGPGVEDRHLPLTDSMLGAITDLPPSAHLVIEVLTDGLVLLLGCVIVFEWWYARQGSCRAVASALLAPTAVLAVLAASTTIKSSTAVARPCQYLDLAVPGGCPAPPDWSFPSNHAALAAAAAAVWCVMRVRRGGHVWSAVVVAVTIPLVVAGTRVALGVHAVVDVLAGLGLGALVVLVIQTVAVVPVATAVGHLRARHRLTWLIGSETSGRALSTGVER